MRWRGFNLTSMFLTPGDPRWPDMFPWEPAGFRETDFAWIADWGFNFVRLPVNYRIWTDAHDPGRMDERELAKIDRALRYGERHGLHVMLNLHHAPGWGVCEKPIPGFSLWSDGAALDAFVQQWELFARRYRGIPAARLSFNLVNEPWCDRAAHERVMRRAVAAIRAIDPERTVALDGLNGGGTALPELDDLGVVQCGRAYAPVEVSHFRAWWLRTEEPEAMAWPLHVKSWGHVVDRAALRRLVEEQGWVEQAQAGRPLLCGEMGAYKHTPHAVMIAWMRDWLSIWGELGAGFALWNFRGCVGILDSDRQDVAYEDWYGHRLDRELLELLQAA